MEEESLQEQINALRDALNQSVRDIHLCNNILIITKGNGNTITYDLPSMREPIARLSGDEEGRVQLRKV